MFDPVPWLVRDVQDSVSEGEGEKESDGSQDPAVPGTGGVSCQRVQIQSEKPSHFITDEPPPLARTEHCGIPITIFFPKTPLLFQNLLAHH